MKSAIRFLSTGGEQLKSQLLVGDGDKNLTDLGLRNEKIVEISTNFKSSFHIKFNSSPLDLRNLLTVVCSLAEMCNVTKEMQRKLILELEKTNESTEAAANLLQRMESKYISMKLQVKEGKILAQQQQQKLGQYLNAINILSTKKEIVDDAKIKSESKKLLNNQQIKNIADENNLQDGEVKMRNDTILQQPIHGCNTVSKGGSSTLASTLHDHDDNCVAVSVSVTPLSVAADDEDVKMLRETLNFVEILALNATELEKRYSEVLTEKRLLKNMCAG